VDSASRSRTSLRRSVIACLTKGLQVHPPIPTLGRLMDGALLTRSRHWAGSLSRCACRLRLAPPAQPRPARPRPSRASVPGSGTGTSEVNATLRKGIPRIRSGHSARVWCVGEGIKDGRCSRRSFPSESRKSIAHGAELDAARRKGRIARQREQEVHPRAVSLSEVNPASQNPVTPSGRVIEPLLPRPEVSRLPLTRNLPRSRRR